MSIKDHNTLGVLCALAVKYKIIYWKCHWNSTWKRQGDLKHVLKNLTICYYSIDSKALHI